ncbi:hypothetical protein ACP4OV_009953 [Aristida adscensionis]
MSGHQEVQEVHDQAPQPPAGGGHVEGQQPPPEPGELMVFGHRVATVNGLPAPAGTVADAIGRGVQAVLATLTLACLYPLSPKKYERLPILFYLGGATASMFVWCALLYVVDLVADMAEHNLRTPTVLSIIIIGDTVITTLMLSAASVSGGIIVLLVVDLDLCSDFPCDTFTAMTVAAFLSWLMVVPVLFLNIWTLASILYQIPLSRINMVHFLSIESSYGMVLRRTRNF